MQETTITYDHKATLTAPDGGVLDSIAVTVEIEPSSAGCLIYGWQKNGAMGCVEVRGAKSELQLPFCKPEVLVKYLGGLSSLKIYTRGFELSR